MLDSHMQLIIHCLILLSSLPLHLRPSPLRVLLVTEGFLAATEMMVQRVPKVTGELKVNQAFLELM